MQPGSANNGIVQAQVLDNRKQDLLNYRPCLDGKSNAAHRYCGCPVKPEQDSGNRTQPVKEIFIFLKAGNYNRLTVLPGLTCTLCTSKSLIHRVSTSASWCGVMTLDGLTSGNDIGSSISWIALLLSGTWMVFTIARVMATRNSFLFWSLD